MYSSFTRDNWIYTHWILLQTLYERILSAKKNALTAEMNWKNVKDTEPPNLYAK
jgi:paired amphipathic helix protein Sin3a